MADGYNMPNDVPENGDYGHPVWNQIAREFLKYGVTPTFGMVSQWGTDVNGGYLNQIASAIRQQYGEGGPQAPGAQPAAGATSGGGGRAWDEAAFRQGWLAQGGGVEGLRRYVESGGWGPHVRLVGSKGDKIQLPDGRVIDAVRGAGAGGLDPQWLDESVAGGGGGGLGMGDLIKPFTEQFTYADFVAPTEQDLQGDPGLAASIAKAKDTLERSAAARGSFLTGSTVQDIADRTASLTQDAYQNLYGRRLTEYNTNRGNAFDQYAQRRANFYQNQDSPFAKLFGMAQLESSDRNAWANQQLGWAQLGANTIAGGADRANQYGIGGANAAAAGQAGSGNAYSSLFGGLSQIPWYLASALRPGGSTRPAMPGTY